MNEQIVAVIPIRSFRNGKTRLSPVLGLKSRAALLQQSAARVIDAARGSGVIETILVVSPDAEALAWAAELGPEIVALAQPSERPGLNGAIDAGREWAREAGAAAMLSLFADLPLLSPGDIHGLIAHPEALVLGADRRGEGTNALLLRLAGSGADFRFAFGDGSLAKHLDEARRVDLSVAVHHAAGVGFDLDNPEDWDDFLQAAAGHALLSEPFAAACGACAG